MSSSVGQDPMLEFMFALKAPDTKRQYPKRLKTFFDFLTLRGSIQEQAQEFLMKAREDIHWAEIMLIKFINFQKERVGRGEIVNAIIRNYIKATKLFCMMNDVAINWDKIK